MQEDSTVGIDVSQEWLDFYVHPEGHGRRIYSSQLKKLQWFRSNAARALPLARFF